MRPGRVRGGGRVQCREWGERQSAVLVFTSGQALTVFRNSGVLGRVSPQLGQREVAQILPGPARPKATRPCVSTWNGNLPASYLSWTVLHVLWACVGIQGRGHRGAADGDGPQIGRFVAYLHGG